MRKSKIETNNELQNNLDFKLYELLLNDALKNIEYHDHLSKKIREELIKYEENEPFKLFKKAHQNWVDSKKNLQNLYKRIFDELRQEYKELEEIIDLNPHHI